MKSRRAIARLVLPAALAALSVAFWPARRVETSPDALVGEAREAIAPSVRALSAGLVPIVVSSASRDLARHAADELFAALKSVAVDGECAGHFCLDIHYRQTGDELEGLLDVLQKHRAGLASPEAARRLATSEGRRALARAALRRYATSPVPSLFGFETDPFCLLDGFVTSLPSSQAGWFPEDGVLTASRDGLFHVLVVPEVKDVYLGDVDGLIRFRRALDAAIASATHAGDGVTISACGAPLHTALAAGNCKREIGLLTWLSFGFIVFLSAVVFRGVRWIPLLALSLVTAVSAGLLALSLGFGTFHMMTLVMGTTVLGLVIDYSFHWLLAAEAHRRETCRNLAVSFVTTEISLVPLMLSSIPVLRQSAVFLGIGLAAALGYVLTCYPRPSAADAAGTERPRRTVWARALVAITLALAVWGWRSVRFGTELTAVYRPPMSLAVAERRFAEISRTADGDRGFVETVADDFETALAKEESLALPDDLPRLSRFFPSLETRREVMANVRLLYAEQGGRLAAALGVERLEPPPEPTDWKPGELPSALTRRFVHCSWSQGARHETYSLAVVGSPRPAVPLPEGVAFFQPASTVAAVLTEWSRETLRRLGLALGMMFVALLAWYRARAVRVIAPSAFALAVAAGVVGLAGEKVNLFHLLAGFLLAGMSVDYTVFVLSGKSLKPVVCSLLTSVVGFGSLAFVSFPVVRSFGLVLGVGLPVAFVAAVAARRAPRLQRAA